MTKNNDHTVIIAEAGVNHNGDVKKAYDLIDAAKSCGADYVKFQTFKADQLVSSKAPRAAYQKDNTGDRQYNMLKKLELSDEEFTDLKRYCDKKGIGFLSTAFDLQSVDFVNSLDPDYLKIPSGELTNLPYLKKIGALKKRVLLSTGMAHLQEVEEAMEVLQESGCDLDLIVIMHCTSAYPAPITEVNLRAMQTMGEHFKTNVGYSDHTTGKLVPLAAVARCASVIEKHLTLDQSMPGPDHKASMEPVAFKELVDAIRMVEQAKGDGKKVAVESEIENRLVVRKSIHLSVNLEKGAEISANNLQMLRPGDGISPMEMDKVIGSVLAKPLKKGHKLQWADMV